jgi:hypothetical protein
MSKKYNYNDIINLKKRLISESKHMLYNYSYDIKYDKRKLNINLLDPEFIEYLNQNYKIESKYSNSFIFDTIESNKNTGILFNNMESITESMSYYLFEKLTGLKHTSVDRNLPHFLVTTDIKKSDTNSVIWGSGFRENKTISYKNIYCVSGPESISILKQQNIIIEKHGNPLLLTSLLYPKRCLNKNKLGLVVNNYLYKKVQKKYEPHIFSTRGIFNCCYKINKFINRLLQYEYILTNSIEIMSLCNSYNIKVIYFKDYSFDTDIMINDYFLGISNNIPSLLSGLNKIINNFENYKCNYIKPLLLKERQSDLINSCPFIDKGLKPLLLKMV